MLIFGNWKSNITKNEAKIWLEKYSNINLDPSLKVVIFPPYTLLDFVSSYVKDNNIAINVGAQDISAFNKGAFTGEVSGDLIREFADYVLIGHIERRKLIGEDKELINEKIKRARECGLKVIFCASNLEEVAGIDISDLIIAFEPISAVGTSNPADVEMVKHFLNELSDKSVKIIYGGSINSENVKKYTELENMSGVLVGSGSLNPQAFMDIIKNAV